MLRRFVFAVLLVAPLVALTGTSHAQQMTFGTAAEARKSIDAVMTNVSAGNYDAAWKQLRVVSTFPDAEFDAFVAKFGTQSASIAQRYGPALGTEFVREEKAGNSLVRLSYLSRYERSGLRWYFVLYRSKSGWALIDFKVDSNLDALFP
jgi:hypothetical protein